MAKKIEFGEAFQTFNENVGIQLNNLTESATTVPECNIYVSFNEGEDWILDEDNLLTSDEGTVALVVMNAQPRNKMFKVEENDDITDYELYWI